MCLLGGIGWLFLFDCLFFFLLKERGKHCIGSLLKNTVVFFFLISVNDCKAFLEDKSASFNSFSIFGMISL